MFKTQSIKKDKTHVGANKWFALCDVKKPHYVLLFAKSFKDRATLNIRQSTKHTLLTFLLKKCFISVIVMTIPFITSIYHERKQHYIVWQQKRISISGNGCRK